jgi:hypothetical protein
MIDRTTLRASAVATLKAANTSAGSSVFSPLDWPTAPGAYPLIIVRTPRERKENAAPRYGPPTFFTTVSLAVTGRVEATTEAEAEAALELLSVQVEQALLTNGQFIFDNEIQQFSSVETTMDVVSESGQHYGETVVTFAVEVQQTYDPVIDAAGAVIGPALTEMDITIEDAATGKVLAGETITMTGA